MFLRSDNMNEKINAIKEYLKFYPDSSEAKQNLIFCTYMQELGLENSDSYYPRMQGLQFRLNTQMFVVKKYTLTNPIKNYIPNGVDTLIVWKADAGRCDFVLSDYWFSIEKEWHWLHNTLHEYKPLDYDEVNNTYLFDIENGMKLFNDYSDLMKKFNKMLKDKITTVQIEKKKKELEKLQAQQ
jgi:hypothetical protein